MKPAIADGHTVTLHYRLTLDDGTVADDSFGGDPVTYRHGGNGVVPGLERGLAGKRVGDEFEVQVGPDDGYGPYDPAAEQAVPRAHFPADVEIQAGMPVQADGPQGPVTLWVRSVDDANVVVTSNHPLAGRTLIYTVRIIDVRETPAGEPAPGGSG